MENMQAEWTFVRGLTMDLLNACTTDDLTFELSPQCGPLWKQFRHMGRVHEEYLTALRTGQVKFDPSSGSYNQGKSKPGLVNYFAKLHDLHAELFRGVGSEARISWFVQTISPEIHLVRLISHETLHHGQLILYWRALGKPFPKSWESWGES